MKRNVVNRAFIIGQLEDVSTIVGKLNLIEGNVEDLICDSVVISQLELTLAKIGIPPDAAQKFMDWLHDV